MTSAFGHLFTQPISFLSTVIWHTAPFEEKETTTAANRSNAPAASTDASQLSPSAPTTRVPAHCCKLAAARHASSADAARLSEPRPRYLVVGLGNPGRPFTGTRHNIGRDMIEHIVKQWSATGNEAGEDAQQQQTKRIRSGSKKSQQASKTPLVSAANEIKICASRVTSTTSERIAELQKLHLSDAAELPRKTLADNAPPPIVCSCSSSDRSSSTASTTCSCSVLFALPDVLMNLSGRAVSALSQHYRIPARRILLLYDDVSLPLGTLRIKPSGGPGGHNGARSVLDAMGGEKRCEGMVRMRVGVGMVKERDEEEEEQQVDAKRSKQDRRAAKVQAVVFPSGSPLNSYVLGSFTHEEQKQLAQIREKVAQAVLLLTQPSVPGTDHERTAAPSSNNSDSATSATSAAPSCCCLYSTDSTADRLKRLEMAMTRFNGAHILAQ
jgi:peptidyl-tRNA hydrolase